MKQFEDIFKERLEDYEMKLPASDRDAFLNRKATRERFARRRRNILNVAVGLPAAAAILCTVLLSIQLLKPSQPLTIAHGIDPSALGLPDSFGNSKIIYDLGYILDAKHGNTGFDILTEGIDVSEYLDTEPSFPVDETPVINFLPIKEGSEVIGILIKWDLEEYKPLKGANVEEIDRSGKTVNRTMSDENGFFSIRITNPADSILVNAQGYEPIKFEPFCLEGQIASTTLSKVDEICRVVSDQPEFPGGRQALQDFIKNNQQYPADALKEGIKGRVLVQFVVEKDGSITNIEVVKHVHPLLDAEAVRIVSTMPRWKPGKQFGFPRRVLYTIPVNFRLN